MLYSLVELNRAAMAPMRLAARAGRMALHSPMNPIAKTDYGKALIAFADVFESTTRYYGKPDWNIESVRINSAPVPVTPSIAWRSPWCNLVHFRKDPDALAAARKPGSAPLPRLLIVAPLSGHYATLLRGTVARSACKAAGRSVSLHWYLRSGRRWPPEARASFSGPQCAAMPAAEPKR